MKQTDKQLRVKAMALIHHVASTTPEAIRVVGMPIEGHPNPAPGDLTETKCDLCGIPVFSTRLNELIRYYTTLIHNPSVLCCPPCMKKELSRPNAVAYHV